MQASSDSEPDVRRPRTYDAFSQYMVSHIETTQASYNALTTRADELIKGYFTMVSATLGAMVLLVAAMFQNRSVVFATLGAAGIVVGMVGMLQVFRYAVARRYRLALGEKLYQLHLFYDDMDPIAFRQYRCGSEVSLMLSWERSDFIILLAIGLAHCVLFSVGAGLLACAVVLANPLMPLSLNMWWIVMLVIVLSVILIAGTVWGYWRYQLLKAPLPLSPTRAGPGR